MFDERKKVLIFFSFVVVLREEREEGERRRRGTMIHGEQRAVGFQSASDVKVYNLTAGKTLPRWLSSTKKKSLRRDPEFQKQIEIIQDLDFKDSCQCIHASRDGNFIAAAGIYAPQLKMFDVNQMSMKFERHIDAQVVKFQVCFHPFLLAFTLPSFSFFFSFFFFPWN